MRLFGYYAFHTIKNGIRKLFRTWVAVLIAICILVGVIFGVGAVIIENITSTGTEDVQEQEQETENEAPDPETARGIINIAVIAASLAFIGFNIYTGDKSGGAIFNMADVNLLFPSPMRPQSVLLFKTLTQLGVYVLASIYMVFQLPNLIFNAGLSVWCAVSLLFVWMFIIIFSKLIGILVYTLCSSHEWFKTVSTYSVYAMALALAVGYGALVSVGKMHFIDALFKLFSYRFWSFIPVVGQLRQLAISGFDGSLTGCLIAVAILLVIGVILVFTIWKIKADFYESALSKSEVTAQKLKAAQTGEKVRRTKDRSDRLSHDIMTRGEGANVFFYKTMLNRRRFAKLGFLTKTTITYIVAAVCAALITKSAAAGGADFTAVALILAGLVFFRSLGNPVSEDTENNYFWLVPESAFARMFYSFAGGIANTVCDLIPALVIATVIIGGNPLITLVWLLFMLSVDVYSSSVGAFINLSLPSYVAQKIKAMVQVMFVYFGLLPVAIIIILGFVFKMLPLFVIISVLVNLVLGTAFFMLSPMLIDRGKK